ncbi:MAG TPA: UPF0182 family protein, partial [Gemmatimonadaceae bacterium]|nr:UPF0182 family protein [Gemmatimonadaceae bacterium]
QSVVSLVFPRRIGNLEIGEEVPGRYLMGAAIGLSLLLGVVLAVPHADWTTVVLATSGAPFHELDPYFGRDLSFFVNWLPFETALWTWAFSCIAVVGITVVLLYALTPSLRWQRGSLYASAYVRRHCTVLAGALLLLLAWSFRLDMYSLVADGSGLDGAFSFVDHRVGIPGDIILGLVTLGAGLIVVWAGFVGQFRLAGVAALTVVSLSVAARQITPFVVQHTGTEVERAERERPYLATRAGYTRRAFAVDAIVKADSTIAYPTLQSALPWVSAWDPNALARAIDGGRAGNDRDVRAAWRPAAAGLVADVVNPPAVGAAPRTPWTVSRVIAADADDHGAPLRVGGADASNMDDLPLDAPLVFPGASPFTIIADSLEHTAGTSLESFWTRLASAWSLQNFHIVGGDLPQPHPTIISHRDVRDRVDRIAPFFAQGRHVAPVLVGDSLYWTLDLYSASDTYPLSRHFTLAGADRSYLHHAAVAIVQASTGDVSVVPDSVLDPIAATWVHRLPSIFGAWSSLPAGMRTLLAPAIDGAYAQAAAFGRYGTPPDTDVARHVPTIDGADTTLIGDDLPLVLPGAHATAIVLPLVDDMDRLRGVLVANGGATQRTAWYAVDAPGPRWSAVLDRLRSIDSSGAAVREGPLARGRVRVIPLRAAGGVAFIQPTYRWRPQSIPALNRISVLVGDTTRSVAAGGQENSGGPQTPSDRASIASAAALYNAVRDAKRRGDWLAFGKAFDALGRALGQPSKR